MTTTRRSNIRLPYWSCLHARAYQRYHGIHPVYRTYPCSCPSTYHRSWNRMGACYSTHHPLPYHPAIREQYPRSLCDEQESRPLTIPRLHRDACRCDTRRNPRYHTGNSRRGSMPGCLSGIPEKAWWSLDWYTWSWAENGQNSKEKIDKQVVLATIQL